MSTNRAAGHPYKARNAQPIDVPSLLEALDANDRLILESCEIGRQSNKGFTPLTREELNSTDRLIKAGLVTSARLLSRIPARTFDNFNPFQREHETRGLEKQLTLRRYEVSGILVVEIPPSYETTDLGLAVLSILARTERDDDFQEAM